MQMPRGANFKRKQVFRECIISQSPRQYAFFILLNVLRPLFCALTLG